MGTLAAAYFVAWLAVAAYTTRLGLVNRQLARRLESLEEPQHATDTALKNARAA